MKFHQRFLPVLSLAVIAVLATTALQWTASINAQSHDGHDHGPTQRAETDDHDDHAGHAHDTADSDDHDEHGAAAKTDGHDDHAGHAHGPDVSDDHGDHGSTDNADDHDDHSGHGHDEEEGGLTVDPATMSAFGIEVEKAGPGTVTETTRLPGEVVFNADLIAHVTPSVAGLVRRVNHSVGDRVESGDVLAVLSSRELALARSEYLAAQARLALAKDSLARDEKLLSDRIGTERQVLETRQMVREAEIALNLSEQNLHALGQSHPEIGALDNATNASFSEYELRSPLDGVIIERHLTRGERVSDAPELAPVVVADLSSVWVNLTVYQRDLASVQTGTKVRIEFGHRIPDAKGTIAFVSPALDEQTRTAQARVVLENPEGAWRPGMFVSATVQSAAAQSDVVLPRSALQEIEGQPAVFIQTEDGFEPRTVRLGRETDTSIEILDGVRPGESVVVRNGFALKAEMNRGALEHAGHAH